MKLPEDRWISIEKELPADGEHILTYGYPYGYIKKSPYRTAIFEVKYGFQADHFCEYDGVEEVTHWMPLPKPPEEVKQ